MDNKKMLGNEELEKVVGGIESANIVGYGGSAPELPAQQLRDNVYQEMFKAVDELGDGKDVGTWKTMSGEEYMQWWRSLNKK